MSAYSIKNQEKVLKKLIQLRNDSDTPWIYRPKNFEDNFPFIEPQFLIDILAMLQANEYVNVVYADLPESFNIETISITEKGLNYFPNKKLQDREKRFTHFHIWANTAIAALALILSIIALILQSGLL